MNNNDRSGPWPRKSSCVRGFDVIAGLEQGGVTA